MILFVIAQAAVFVFYFLWSIGKILDLHINLLASRKLLNEALARCEAMNIHLNELRSILGVQIAKEKLAPMQAEMDKRTKDGAWPTN